MGNLRVSKSNMRKIKGYMVFDAYEIADVTGNYEKVYRMYKGTQFLGFAVFK